MFHKTTGLLRPDQGVLANKGTLLKTIPKVKAQSRVDNAQSKPLL